MFRAKLRVHCIIKTIQPTHTQSPRTRPLPLPMPLIVGWWVLEIRIIYVTITLSAQTVRFYPRAALVVMATSGLPLSSFVAVSCVCVSHRGLLNNRSSSSAAAWRTVSLYYYYLLPRLFRFLMPLLPLVVVQFFLPWIMCRESSVRVLFSLWLWHKIERRINCRFAPSTSLPSLHVLDSRPWWRRIAVTILWDLTIFYRVCVCTQMSVCDDPCWIA